MKLVILSIILFSFFYGYISLTYYHSAFEADQSCHYALNSSEEVGRYGCDHDLETHQWILYRQSGGIEPATVVKRFKYR